LIVVLAAGLFVMNRAGASSLTTTDPAGDATGGTAPAIDIVAVSHSDTSSAITYSAKTKDAFGNTADFFQMKWNLDLDNDGVFGVGSNDACILLEQDGNGGIQAELKKTCSGGAALTSPVTTSTAGGGETLTFSFDLAQLKTATGFQGSSYGYKVSSLDAHGNRDSVPDANANPNFITHTLGGSTSSPTADPSPQASASATPDPTATPHPSSTAVISGAGTSSRGSSGAGGTSSTSDASNTLPRTGANIMLFIIVAMACIYAGIELIGANIRLHRE
jgi:hypothetical protein